MIEYGSPEYWQNRILDVGCGTAPFTQHLYDEGFRDITHIDISPHAIESMAQRNTGRPGMKFLTMDATDMHAFPNCSFDFVVDKCTVDCLMCSDQYLLTVAKVINEVFRVLKEGGRYVVVSYAEPYFREYLFKRKCNSFDVKVVSSIHEEEKKMFYVYVCTKTGPYVEEIFKKEWVDIECELKKELQEENKKKIRVGPNQAQKKTAPIQQTPPTHKKKWKPQPSQKKQQEQFKLFDD